MKKKDKAEFTVNKIEYDEHSKEPKIVKISEKEFLAQQSANVAGLKDKDFVKLKSEKGTRSKMVAEQVLGIKKEENINKRQKVAKNLVTALFIIFVVGVLAFTAYNDFFASGKPLPSFEELKSIFMQNWFFFFLALFALFISFFSKGLKISLMCKSMTGKWHLKTSIETGIIGIYYNNVTPLAVGGQPFEIYHLSKHGVHGGVASSIPIATFFLNQFAFVLLGIVAIITINAKTFGESIIPNFSVFNVLAIIGLICCIFMPSLVVTFSLLPKVGAKLVHVVMRIGAKLRLVKNLKETTDKTIETVVHNSHCLKKIATNPLLFSSTFLLSFVENLSNASIAYFCLKAFGYQNPSVGLFTEWAQVVSICFILFASITFIPTPGNSGAADLSFYLLFSAGLTQGGLAFPAMVTWRLISFYSTLIIGFIFATTKKKSDAKKLARQQAFTPLENLERENSNKE